ncbi:hypothetical protein L195_g061571 [Trifolium pratense]|uniref:Uncharacterized protein n=1 Tax=Trifolium pratense TaxID=57577 RepID=A0A2K3KAK1_TRIPR|nr:hypothetical protein L195_g061571 [Trifolium pratense]
MRSSSAPWRSSQRWNLPNQGSIAPCAAILRHGAGTSGIHSQERPTMRHAQPSGAMAQPTVKNTYSKAHNCAMRSQLAPWRSLQGKLSLKRDQHCAMRNLLRPGAV